MFDYVKFQGETHQTKHFDCEMDSYSIEGGRLLKEQWHWEPPYPSEERKAVADPPKDMNYHGMLNFYARHDWLAKFTDGNLVELEDLETKEKFQFKDGTVIPTPAPERA